jgi:hypothetical protein
MEPKLSGKQTRMIREWAEAYRLWNARERARRRLQAGRESVEEKLRAFFDLCETMWQISPPKSKSLYEAHLRAHVEERRRMLRFEELRAHGKSTTY